MVASMAVLSNGGGSPPRGKYIILRRELDALIIDHIIKNIKETNAVLDNKFKSNDASSIHALCQFY